MKIVPKISFFNNTSHYLRKWVWPLETHNRPNHYATIATDINNQKVQVDKGKETENKISSSTPKKRKPNGLQKDCELNGPLKEFLNLNKASKIDVLKYTWKYIKDNNLQNPNKKRQIIPDEKLRQVLDKNEVDMLEMPKLLFKHMSKIPENETAS